MAPDAKSIPIPTRLLHRICGLDTAPIAIALCPDFAGGSWRYKRLADHVFDWLPDVALRPMERVGMLHEPHKTLATSCRRLFDTCEPETRGEVGEVLLHAVCRQEFDTIPIVARLFYKMRTNDSVTSVDVVHLLYNQASDKLELWLGEAKLYSNLADARYKALKSIEPIWDLEFLNEMKALVGPKIEASEPYAEALTWLFADETSIDRLVEKIVIPICIACDYEPTVIADSRNAAYISQIESELLNLQSYFKTRVPVDVRVVCIFIPMDDKNKLEEAVNNKVQAFL